MPTKIREKVSDAWFRLIHQRNLVYNTCWEDPRLDRTALELTSDDSVLVITSAGCNALDYALSEPRHVYAVDVNPFQNALLDLKLAAIKTLDHDDCFAIFGRGQSDRWPEIYLDAIRPELSPGNQRIWDKRGHFFAAKGRRKSFYFHGSSGMFAWMVNKHINRLSGCRAAVNELLDAGCIDEQREIFDRYQLAEVLWTPLVKWCLRRNTTLAMLGVPRPQRRQLDENYDGGIVQFIVDRIEEVFTTLPLRDNYFWRVYLTGQYTPDCCPDYLTKDGLDRLKSGLANRVSTHTDTVLGFLDQHPGTISRFVLLDHMDWLWSSAPDVLAAEWESILSKAAPASKAIWRSAGFSVDFVDQLKVDRGNGPHPLSESLSYCHQLATDIHPRDRVHTYGSFWIADILPT
jgi:S-adenosylmethionine-diacylglycerol 3-amino-3-carboxypropyl transferase